MTEYRFGAAIVRLHGTYDKEKLKAASEQFCKRVMAAGKKIGKEMEDHAHISDRRSAG